MGSPHRKTAKLPDREMPLSCGQHSCGGQFEWEARIEKAAKAPDREIPLSCGQHSCGRQFEWETRIEKAAKAPDREIPLPSPRFPAESSSSSKPV